MLSFSTSSWHFIKFPYSAGATERRDRVWKQAQRQGDFTTNFKFVKNNHFTARTMVCCRALFSVCRFLMIVLWANISQTQHNFSKDLVHSFSLSLHLHMMNNPWTSDVSVLIKWLPELIECSYNVFFLSCKGCSLLGPLLVPCSPLVYWRVVGDIWVRTRLLGPLLVPPGPLVNGIIAGEISVRTGLLGPLVNWIISGEIWVRTGPGGTSYHLTEQLLILP
jgi:hypothetical protein